MTEEGNSALSVAISYRHRHIVEALISRGCDVNQLPPEDAPRYSALHSNYGEESGSLLGVACNLGPLEDGQPWEVEMPRLLLQAGADPGLKDRAGQTLLAELADWGNADSLELVQLLLSQTGCRLAALGWRPAMCAAVRHGPDCPVLLELLRAPAARGLPALAQPDCDDIVRALLDHIQGQLQWQPKGVREREEWEHKLITRAVATVELLAAHGVSADLTGVIRKYRPPCRPVLLAAVPPERRWSPARCRYFPPRFRSAAQALVMASSRQASQRQAGRAALQQEAEGSRVDWLAAAPARSTRRVLRARRQTLSMEAVQLAMEAMQLATPPLLPRHPQQQVGGAEVGAKAAEAAHAGQEQGLSPRRFGGSVQPAALVAVPAEEAAAETVAASTPCDSSDAHGAQPTPFPATCTCVFSPAPVEQLRQARQPAEKVWAGMPSDILHAVLAALAAQPLSTWL